MKYKKVTEEQTKQMIDCITEIEYCIRNNYMIPNYIYLNITNILININTLNSAYNSNKEDLCNKLK